MIGMVGVFPVCMGLDFLDGMGLGIGALAKVDMAKSSSFLSPLQ
jgi:hypothetical protein